MRFFTSPDDLQDWLGRQSGAAEATNDVLEVVGSEDALSIKQACTDWFALNEAEEKEPDRMHDVAAGLFNILAKYNITEGTGTKREGHMKKETMKREAQIYRGTAPLYQNMEMRVCPKLIKSVGRVVNTIHCRDRCLDSIFFDDDPKRVYCAEALWRRHIMDKFSREFKDEEGKWVGGYINERFQVFHDDGGNQMELANDERTRKPRPHQYSTERRLEEGRGEDTKDILPIGAEASAPKTMVKIAAADVEEGNDAVYQAFSDIVDMKEDGIASDEIISKVAKHYQMSPLDVAVLHKHASKHMLRHEGIVYACSADEGKKIVTAAQQEEWIELDAPLNVRDVNQNPVASPLPQGTMVQYVKASDGSEELEVLVQENGGELARYVVDSVLTEMADESLEGQKYDPNGQPMEEFVIEDKTVVEEKTAPDDAPEVEGQPLPFPDDFGITDVTPSA